MSRCLRVGWTGLGGATRLVGRLVLGHTALVWSGGWGRQFILRTAPRGASAGLLGQTPPMSLRRLGEMLERLTGDVASRTAHDLSGVQALGSPPPDVVAGLIIGCHAGQHDAVERSVGLPSGPSWVRRRRCYISDSHGTKWTLLRMLGSFGKSPAGGPLPSIGLGRGRPGGS